MSQGEGFKKLPTGEFLYNTPHQLFHSSVRFGSNDLGILNVSKSLYAPYAALDLQSFPVEAMINRLNHNHFELKVSSFPTQIYSSQWEAMLLFKAQLVQFFWRDSVQPLLLHAGAVSKDNKGILLIGDDGSGKTTQTIGLVHNGYNFLSDEYGVVNLRTGLMTHYPAPIALQPDSLVLERNLVGLGNKVDPLLFEINVHETDPGRIDEQKSVLPAPISNQTINDVPPKAIFILESTFGNVPTLKQMTQRDEIIEIVRRNANWHSKWSFPPVELVQAFFNRVVKEIPVFKLSVGDLDRTCALINEMVVQL